MMQKNKLPFLFFIVMLLSQLSACVTYYKTSDINNNTAKLIQQSKENSAKVTKDYQDFLFMQRELLQYTKTAEAGPYSEMSVLIKEMEVSVTEIKAAENLIVNTREALDFVVKGKDRIQSDSSDWSKFNEIRKQQQIIAKQYAIKMEHYQQVREQLLRLLNKHKVAKLKVITIQTQGKAYTDKATLQINQVKTRLIQAKEKIETYHAREAERNRIAKLKSRLLDMEAVVEKIEAKNIQLQNLMNGFEAEANVRKEIWVGPGMRTHTLLVNMTAIGNDINALAERFNELTKQIK